MNREIIAHILSIETDAEKVQDDAQRQAAHIIEEAEKTASSLLARAQAEGREEAKQLISAGKETAKVEREQILAEAESEAAQLESIAAEHIDKAVHFVLDQIAARE